MTPLQSRLVQVVFGAFVIVGLGFIVLGVYSAVVGYRDFILTLLIGAALCGVGWAIRYVFTGRTK
jgi:hypothetical protein